MSKKYVILICFALLFDAVTPGIPYTARQHPNSIPRPNLETTKDMVQFLQSATHPHKELNSLELVDLYKYNAEAHHVTTEDGYILGLHRITGRNPKANQTKPVILLMHGILASSSDWVIAGPETGLGFILSDEGFDVWMGNARGNVYSKNHTRYNVDSPQFWDFSWHEIGYYDLPAKIDYILKVTGQEKLIFIGHSQGTTAFYVMASERTEYNDKVHRMISLAPISFSGNMFSPLLKYLARFVDLADFVMDMIGVYSIEPTDELLKLAKNLLCSNDSLLQTVCLNLIFMICGYDQAQTNVTLLPAIMSHVPAGSSVKQFIHFGQIIKTGRFRKFDYGFFGNLDKYDSTEPPSYNTANIKVPVALFYSYNDWLSHPKDVDSLYKTLENPIGKFKVHFDEFNHLDYLWAIDVKSLLYRDLLKMITLS